MEEKSGVKLALVASGSGTDADSIMKAWRAGCISEVDNILLISTKEGAGCLAKAGDLGIDTIVVPCKGPSEIGYFNRNLKDVLRVRGIDLVFLVGCVHKVFTIDGILICNIHPADPKKHGGDKMYGLAVHEHVLEEIGDIMFRGRGITTTRFFTIPTVHEVNYGGYDTGVFLLQQAVEIPPIIISEYINGKIDPLKAAKKLQDHVLPYEHLMLPPAVRMAAKRILGRKEGG